MKTTVIIENDDGTISITKEARNETFQLKNEDGQSFWVTEEELRQLKWMIDEIIETLKKRDY